MKCKIKSGTSESAAALNRIDDFETVKMELSMLVNIFETAWYQEIRAALMPGESLKIYRENLGVTQAELAQKLAMPKQKIADLENNACHIPEDVARKLSQFFEVPLDRFL